MSDDSDSDDYEYNYSDDDDESDGEGGADDMVVEGSDGSEAKPLSTLTSSTSKLPSSSSYTMASDLDEQAMEKRLYRNSPTPQRAWVTFCWHLLKLSQSSKSEQQAKYFSSFSSPNKKTLSNSYLMVDYDLPDLSTISITVLDGRDDVRGSLSMKVPWPALPCGSDAPAGAGPGQDASAKADAFARPKDAKKNPQAIVSVLKKGKPATMQQKTLDEALVVRSPWSGKVSSIEQATRKDYDADHSTFSMVYWEGDTVLTLNTAVGSSMPVILAVDGSVEFTAGLKVGSLVGVMDVLGTVTPREPSGKFGEGAASVKARAEVQRDKAKGDAEKQAQITESKLIFPVVPPTVTWRGPRLSFRDMMRVQFLATVQPDRWNMCTDLEVVLKKMFRIILEADVVDPSLELTPIEVQLVELTRLSKIYDDEEDDEEDGESQKLVAFGVDKKFALATPTKKQKMSAAETGFAKGTGYSGGREKTDAGATSKGDMQKAEEIVRSLYLNSGDDVPLDTLLGSCLPRLCALRLKEAGNSIMEIEQHASVYMYVCLWGARLYRRMREEGVEELLPAHGAICRLHEEMKDGGVEASCNGGTLADLDATFWDGAGEPGEMKLKERKAKAKKSATTTTTTTSSSASKVLGKGGEDEEFTCEDVAYVAELLHSTVTSDFGSSVSPAAAAPTAMDVDEEPSYKSSLSPLQVTTVDKFKTHAFIGQKPGPISAKWQKRLAAEFRSMNQTLPLETHGSIFVRWSETQLNLFKVLIVAPLDSPYASGCFEFHVCIPGDYPAQAPKVLIVTTGGGGGVAFQPEPVRRRQGVPQPTRYVGGRALEPRNEQPQPDLHVHLWPHLRRGAVLQ